MMKISIIYKTVQDLGDHGRDVTRAIELVDGETVEALATRLLKSRYNDSVTTYDHIEIRAIEEPPNDQ